jgi:hypothetical protein
LLRNHLKGEDKEEEEEEEKKALLYLEEMNFGFHSSVSVIRFLLFFLCC